jgi:hypothetical protein
MTALARSTARALVRHLGNWREHAACRGASAKLFDPIVGRRPTEAEKRLRTRGAVDFCAECPVVTACGIEADLLHELGVWGGSLRWVNGGGYVAKRLVWQVPRSRFERS